MTEKKKILSRIKRVHSSFTKEKEEETTVDAPHSMYSVRGHAVSPFLKQSASGQSGDLRLSIVSSGSEDIFTALYKKHKGQKNKHGDLQYELENRPGV